MENLKELVKAELSGALSYYTESIQSLQEQSCTLQNSRLYILIQTPCFLTINSGSFTLKHLKNKGVLSMPETYTKSDLIHSVATVNGCSRQESTETVNTLFEIIKRTLESGEDVLISSFGKFCVKEKMERRGRNPATGEDMMLRSRRVVTFQCSGKLREMINR